MDNMDMIEVDPKLFVTCRLCLEDTGQYQIVPSVQKQIKYCFDINVEPFDGLPQLICMKCKQILINFYAIKETLCEKQAKLIKKVNKKVIKETSNKSEPDTGIQPQQDAVSSSQQSIENTGVKKSTHRSKRLIESSDSETSSNLPTTKKTKLLRNKKKWDGPGYTKHFVCRICQASWLTIKSLNNHLRTHNYFKSIYHTVFEKNCSVVLNKVDGKPNLAGTDLVVVHNQNEIIQSFNSFCYIKYEKCTKDICETESKPSNVLESTDSEEEVIVKSTRSKRRISSRSSNDTVVIERESSSEMVAVDNKKTISEIKTDTNQPTTDNKPAESAPSSSYQCISIDDSSDSDADRSQHEPIKAKPPIEAQLGDYKVIQGIIGLCVNAYHKKNDMEKSEKQVNIESQLIHKVLSIGRKTLNKQVVNVTGLLRYLEYKNLGIEWVTKALPNSNSKDSNYIRVITKLRGKEAIDDDFGWIPVEESGAASAGQPESFLSFASPSTKNVSNTHTKNLTTTQSQNLSNTKSPNVSNTKSQNLSNTKSPNVSYTKSQNLSNTKSPNVSNTKSQNLSNTKSPNVSNTKSQNLSNTKSQNLSNSKSQNVSNTQLPNLSTTQSQNSNNIELPNLNTTQSENLSGTHFQIFSSSQPQIINNTVSHFFNNTQDQNLGIPQTPSEDTAVLVLCSPPDPKSKLLNANPVANPKQLPRKIGQTNDTRLTKIPPAPEPSAAFHNTEDNSFMPIITSATSLADPKVVETQSNAIIPADTAPTDRPPRIKVKPVSELMSERTLLSLRNEQAGSASTNNIISNQNENTRNTNEVSSSMENVNNMVLTQMDNMQNNIVLNQNVWSLQNQVPNLYAYTPPLHLVPICLSVTPGTTFQASTTNSPTLPTKNKDEYVIMNTVELPNTRTNAPYQYLKKLLRIYNITLFDPHEPVPPDFFCLIKFKVQFKQEPIEIPVILCLSLFCLKNKFCFTVKDTNHVNIDITTMTPNWQWEIINVFRGDLVDKLLDNAQKHSQETRDFTNQFLCILKSIKFTKLS